MLETEALRGYPGGHTALDPSADLERPSTTLIVLDDDPTGTQSVSDLPVLTRWTRDDFRWALAADTPAIYVETNSRSLDPAAAESINRDVVRAAIDAADGAPLAFVSRGDSTLRGHFPLEPEAIADALEATASISVDGIVLVPAFPDAGRITIGGVHYVRAPGSRLTPVAATEFAEDRTFPYSSSRLAEYIQEKSGGRRRASDVWLLDLKTIRAGPSAVAGVLDQAIARRMIAADAVTEDDLRSLSQGISLSESRGKTFVCRVGPTFVRTKIGQAPRTPLTRGELFTASGPSAVGGLIVVGSHVQRTTQQLAELRSRRPDIRVVELDVRDLVEADQRDAATRTLSAGIAADLAQTDIVVQTSRTVLGGEDAAESLTISRAVSKALSDVIREVVRLKTPRYVLAKGGITSFDIASTALGIRHAFVRGPLLPGLVALWEPADGPARGTPYVVFAGNVGSDSALADVVDLLTARPEHA